MSKNSNEHIKALFDDLSEDYQDRKREKNPFLKYFNEQRLTVSTEHLKKSDKLKILDLGAGTGFLYDHLVNLGIDVSGYFAVDISDDMLSRSSVPVDQRKQASVDDLEVLSERTFDRIFCLGLTTYLSDETLKRLLGSSFDLLNPKGRLIISFTNRSSFDYRSLSVIRRVIPEYFKKGKILSLKSIKGLSTKEAGKLIIDKGFKLDELVYLNQTIFPLNRIFPSLSVRIAKRIKNLRSPSLNRWSSDFLIIASKDS